MRAERCKSASRIAVGFFPIAKRASRKHPCQPTVTYNQMHRGWLRLNGPGVFGNVLSTSRFGIPARDLPMLEVSVLRTGTRHNKGAETRDLPNNELFDHG
jgi:hypothetical protein